MGSIFISKTISVHVHLAIAPVKQLLFLCIVHFNSTIIEYECMQILNVSSSALHAYSIITKV